MPAIEIKELRNFTGTINEMIKVLEKYRRRYPGYNIKWSGNPAINAYIGLEKPEEKEKKDEPRTYSGIFRAAKTQKDS